MSISVLSAEELRRMVSIRDLTDPAQGPHAMQLLLAALTDALLMSWGSELVLRRASPIVSVRDNYDRLRYPPAAVARDARYTRYVCDGAVLRTQTSAMLPPLLTELARARLDDVLLVCPGIVYRRDCIDRLHTGEPHQVDVWRLRRGQALGVAELLDMVEIVVDAVLPGVEHRTLPADHPYTLQGLQIEVKRGEGWVEIGECGLANPALLAECSHDPRVSSGLALGLGLDRLLMLRKGVPDIRLLRSADARVSGQMLDLSPYRPVSRQPSLRRDLSLVVDRRLSTEEIGDLVRHALGARASAIEAVTVLHDIEYEKLPAAVIARLGIGPGQRNLLLRIVCCDLERTLTSDEANQLRDCVYAALHRGTRSEWARAPVQ
jgi:phenylalanyl-tRNA synthetase alpha chain